MYWLSANGQPGLPGGETPGALVAELELSASTQFIILLAKNVTD